MDWKKTKILLVLIILCFSVFVILLVPEILGLPLLGAENIPIGTIVSWIGLTAYSSLFYFIFSNKSKLKILTGFLLINIIFALLWGIISAILSGNWAFLFTNSPVLFKVWIGFTLLVLFVPILVVLVHCFSKLFRN